MTLDIFSHKVGGAPLVWPTDPDEQAMLAVKVLDAVQTIVDVLADANVRYEVRFANTMSASTDTRHKVITISGKPLTEGGRTFAEVVDIMVGFAVHEIGHTRWPFSTQDEWPGKTTPHRLGNILSDVRLEAATIERHAGLADVFVPTMRWVAKATCPTWSLTYGQTVADRINFAGQAVRYEPFVEFANDSDTQDQLRWWREWGEVNASTTNAELSDRVREAIAHIREGATKTEAEEPPTTEGGTESSDEPPPVSDEEDTERTESTEGGGKDGQPDEDGDSDDTDTEGGDGESDGEDEDGEDTTEGGSSTDADDPGADEGEGEGEGESTEGDSEDDSDTEGGTESDTESDTEGGEPTEGEGNDHFNDGQVDEGETLDRTHSDSTMGDGAGGSGQAITDSDPDAGLEESELNEDPTHGEQSDISDRRLQHAVDEERVTTRLDAGAFGKMKVKVQL